jgi:WD40 repeat protein
VAFSPNGKYALSGDSPRPLRSEAEVKLWEISTGREIRTFRGYWGSIQSVAFSSDGKYALSGNVYSVINAWDVSSGREITSFNCFSGEAGEVPLVPEFSFSPDGKFALIGMGNAFKLWEISSGREIRSFEGDSNGVGCSAFSSDGKFALVGSGASLKLLEISSGRQIRIFGSHSEWVRSVGLSSDGKHAISAAKRSGRVFCYIWDISTGHLVRTLEAPETEHFYKTHYLTLAFTPNGKLAFMGPALDGLGVWDVSTGRQIGFLSGHLSHFTSIAVSADGEFALSGSLDDTLKLWEISTGREIRTFKGHSDDITSVAISPDGKYGVSGSRDKTLKVWEISTGREIRTFKGHYWEVTSVAITPDGRFALSGSVDNTLKLWEISTGHEVRTFKAHSDDISSVAISPDGKFVLSGSYDKTLKLWEISTGRQVRTFRGHQVAVTSVQFSHNGRLALSGGFDKTTRLWDITTGKEVVQMVSLADSEWIAITPEGYYNSSLRGHEFLNVRLGNKVYGINQFYDVFYRPDLVEKKLKGEDISKYTSDLTIEEALRFPPPEVVIASPKTRDTFSERTIKVKVKIKDNGGGIGDIRVYHNGKLAHSRGVYRVARSETEQESSKAARGEQGELYQLAKRGVVLMLAEAKKGQSAVAISKVSPLTGTHERTYQINLLRGQNTISVGAFNGRNTIISNMETIEVNGDVAARKPRLFALAVGNDHFLDRSYDLSFAVKDAKDFASLLAQNTRALFEEVQVRVLTDAKKQEIVGAIKQMANDMNQEDIFLFYVASHGRAEDDLYYIITSEFDGSFRLKESAITSVELMEYSKSIPALKHIYILDTCQSGGLGDVVSGLYDARISVLAKSLGMHILAGAKRSQGAIDNYKGNGLFTYFVLRGLEGQADHDRDEKVRVSEVTPYLAKSVTEASQGQQEAFVRNFGEDFVISSILKNR